MNFSDIAPEIRQKIYLKLLVHPESTDFVADRGPPSPPLFRRQRDGLCPAILCVSKMIHREASPLLYSHNRFRFPEVFTSAPSASTSAHIRPFFDQIGSYASHIRHICVPFPSFDYPQPTRALLHEVHIKNLELIRDTCTGVETLELSVPPEHCNYALSHSVIAAEALNLLDMHFKSIPSLKEIIVNLNMYPQRAPSDDLTKKMKNYGWTVKVTELPKKVWISNDDRVEFDNEEDCNAYDSEQFRIEEERDWLEEYYCRRRDPYWKKDSDYD
ncbi:uncharacterized protein A1O9_12910 [Exophiala aquamarina CBS 119918]|uniref:Uncharacterized protein n=1 Tax=Exophiala aquamarina CBS 119918 TaxID=1182545 RepID=A0A072NTP5_9EURO|nr:uncharacterized protein A1O9_12910 [Exophiala aquamarina CBS 119918]KEF51026.1 hypothetical protein A1O9_12910 [Exophiala aquamarina CBS 119918]